MKHLFLVSLILILILLTSCNTQRHIIYRDCITSNNVYTNPYWNWNSYDPFLNFNGWSWYSYNNIPRYYVPRYVPRYVPIQPPRHQVPSNYNRRSTQPQKKVNTNQTSPRRTPVYRNNTQHNKRPSYNVHMTTPSRNYKPSQSVPNRTNQNRTITPSKPILVPSRGGRRN